MLLLLLVMVQLLLHARRRSGGEGAGYVAAAAVHCTKVGRGGGREARVGIGKVVVEVATRAVIKFMFTF